MQIPHHATTPLRAVSAHVYNYLYLNQAYDNRRTEKLFHIRSVFVVRSVRSRSCNRLVNRLILLFRRRRNFSHFRHMFRYVF